MLTLNEILKATNGRVIFGEEYFKGFKAVSTDTRNIEKDSIFIALKGENFNGNKFCDDAIKKGAAVALVDEDEYIKEPKNATIIKVDSCKEALLNLAKVYREKLNIKVIGITGSTGKTSTKDLVAALLSAKYKVFKTKGNFNNEIGLPLMIFSMDKTYDVAVLEMGMSNFSEIHNLSRTANPDISVITNIGISHIENLGSRENILKAKMECTDYFNKNNILVLNNDDNMLQTVCDKEYKIIRTSLDEKSDVFATDISLSEDCSKFYVVYGEEKESFKLDMPGKHNISNCLLGIACAKELSVSFSDMRRGLKNLEATSMRLEIIKREDITIVNDCYNASPASMKSSIDTLKCIEGNRKVAVLGTMRELGEFSKVAHKEVGEFAKLNGIDEIFVTGEYSNFYVEGFGEENAHYYKNKKELILDLNSKLNSNDVVLVKASRGMKFEEITEKLLERFKH